MSKSIYFSLLAFFILIFIFLMGSLFMDVYGGDISEEELKQTHSLYDVQPMVEKYKEIK